MQTGEGAMNEVQSMLQRVRDLAVEYNNGTLSTADKASITAEVAQLCAEISQIGNDTSFNGIALLTGSATITFQIGANDGETIAVTGVQMFGPATGAGATRDRRVDLQLHGLDRDAAVDRRRDPEHLGHARDVRLGPEPARPHAEQPGQLRGEPDRGEIRIQDVDMASEMVNFTKLQVLQQAGTAMLAQANQIPQTVLTLLRG